MAIADKGSIGSGVNTSNVSSYSFGTTTTTVDVGDILIIVSSTDNTSTTDGDNSEMSGVTDNASNTYTKLAEHTHSPTGAAADGVTVSVWMTKATGQMLAGFGSITLNYNSVRVDKCVFGRVFTVSTGATLVQSATAVATDITAANGFGSASFAGLPSLERLYLRAMAKEANSTTGITVSSGFTAIGSVRSSALSTAVLARGEYRVNTSTGETSNPTLAVSGDAASLFLALEELSLSPSFTVPTGSLVLTGRLPTAPVTSGALTFPVPVGTLTFTGQQPLAPIQGNTTIAVPTGVLRFKGPASTSPVFLPDPAALTLTGRAPGLVYLFLTVPTASLSLTGRQPVALVTPSGLFKIPPATLTLTGQYVGQGIGYLQAGVMTLTGYAPALKFGVGRSPDPAALNLNGQPVNAQVSVVLRPAQAQLTFDGQIPDAVLFGQFRPAPGILTFTGWAPQATLGVSANPVLAIPTATLTLTGQTPFLGDDRTFTIPTASLVLTGQVPQGIVKGVGQTIPVPVGVLTLASAGDPLLKYFWVVSPPPARLRLLGPDPEMAGAQFGIGKMSYPSWQSVINS